MYIKRIHTKLIFLVATWNRGTLEYCYKVPLIIILFVIGLLIFKYLFRWYDKVVKERDRGFMVQNADARPGIREFFEKKVQDFCSSNPRESTSPLFSRK